VARRPQGPYPDDGVTGATTDTVSNNDSVKEPTPG